MKKEQLIPGKLTLRNVVLVLLAIAAVIIFQTQCSKNDPLTVITPNLRWQGQKVFLDQQGDTINTKIFLGGFGIDDTVVVVAAQPFNVTHRYINNGNLDMVQSFSINEKIESMTFQYAAGSAGFVPNGVIEYDQTEVVPPLNANQTASISFGPIDSLYCGLHRQTLTLDTTGVVIETDETDNTYVRYIYIPSNQHFNINKTEITTGIAHSDPPQVTTTFTVTLTPGVDSVYFGHFSHYSAVWPDSVNCVPPPPLWITPANSPFVISMWVFPKNHKIPPPLMGMVTGKITCISTDGCIVKQESATVYIEHEWSK